MTESVDLGSPGHDRWHYVIKLSPHEYAEIAQIVLASTVTSFGSSMSTRYAVSHPETAPGKYFGGSPHVEVEE